MQLKDIQEIKAKLSDQFKRGDFVLLSEVLETKRQTAQKRYERNDKNAVLLMERIVENRVELITNLKEQLTIK